MLRIEDLDVGRVREEHVGAQIDDLAEIGLDWDGEIVRQSERTPLYGAALAGLEGEGRTFRCFCSRREVREAASAQHGKAPDGLYPGTCLKVSEDEAAARAADGEPFAVRLRAGRQRVSVTDRFHGEHEDVVDDLVLRRRDGVVAYNLAVVVDDAEQGIGEVVRGDDLMPSTAGQALLCDLLGLGRPRWAHVPLVLGPDGARLAKRHGAVSLADLRGAGWSSGDAVAWMATSLGMAEEGERVDAAELLERFDPATLPADATTYAGG
jgi:glutamyl-tRNA synthetase